MQQRPGNNKFGWFRALARAGIVFLFFVLALQLVWSYTTIRRPRNRGWDTNNRGMPYYSPRRGPMREPEVVDRSGDATGVISVETALSKIQPATKSNDPAE